MVSTDGQNHEMTIREKNNFQKHFILDTVNGDIISFKGDGYGVIGEAFAYKIMDGIYMFKTNVIYRDIDLKGLYSFYDDSLMIYKVMKGNISFAMENDRERRLNCGDILNVSSNFKMSKYHSRNKDVELVGVSYFYKDMKDAIENQSLDRPFLEEFYHSNLLRNGFIHKGNYKINKLFDEIKNAVENDNKILMRAKSLELLSESAAFHRDYKGINFKDFSEEKIILFNSIKEFLDTNLDRYYSMEYMADHFFISLSGLKNIFYEVYGISPYSYHLNKRLEKAATLLEDSGYKISDIYRRVGFNYHSNFSKAFQKKFNCTPSQYRRKMKNK
ncbi:MAG: helix-turn-helix domain-containing protein [Eubacteriales bacterium]|nr:helix-turn-helix domain-containing protein [Eubacteriales bacterium]